MSLVNATTTPRLLRLVESGMLDIGSLVTHHLCFRGLCAKQESWCQVEGYVGGICRVWTCSFPIPLCRNLILWPKSDGATAYKTFQAAATHQTLKVAIDFDH
ncbi:uncharacterized protein N7473_006576 [Penicillium subrubescens]|uniref:uncharacterized protein n=1 Tax=Penicillium subrubescens TaxID=1316194 RepID=UPI0025450C46|nr:uncharacterized protein N7473_006576 [Penicillium subrubescens]KAJ5890348.1 hypothetical protein N7473_006576 [Penicillium subrubescens]